VSDNGTEEVPVTLRSTEVQQIEELKRQGMSISAIAAVMGVDRKTIRKYLARPDPQPRYAPRPKPPSVLAEHQAYVDQRLASGVWNAVVLLRELRERGYGGGYTTLKAYLQPKRTEAKAVAVRRFETPPGKQAQVDWGHLGSLEMNGVERQLHGFTFTLGYSRMLMAEAALDQKLGTLLRMHEEAFRQLGGVPAEILYDRMKTVWIETDERGEIVWNPVFLDFARYWGFTPRLCRPYRAQTKGKIEAGVKYVRRNFLCGLLGREPTGLVELNAELRRWVWDVANARMHGTTHEQPKTRWTAEREQLRAIEGMAPYPYLDDELRKVSRDGFVSWQASRYSVPWQFAGKDVWLRECEQRLEVHYGAERIALHEKVARHRTMIQAEHHRGIPLGDRQRNEKLRIHLQESAPIVEVRSLAAYESAGGGR
jgi:transposase